MQQPSLSRAVPMGVLGFLVGALLVIMVRAVQSLTPVWDVGPGIVFATLFAAGFFVWGIGAFDPRMSVHGEDEHGDAHHAVEAEPTPFGILTSAIWQIAFLTILLILALMIGAKLGPTLITTGDPTAAVESNGAFPMTIGGMEFMVSKLTIFAIFVIWTFISLLVTAALISRVMTLLVEGVNEARLPAGTVVERGPSGWQQAMSNRILRFGIFVVITVLLFPLIYIGLVGLTFGDNQLLSLVVAAAIALVTVYTPQVRLGVFLILVAVLFPLFYYVLIGLVIGNQLTLNFILSLVNAVVIALIIAYTRPVLRLVHRGTALLGKTLRGSGRDDAAKPVRPVRRKD
jgi:hypothetical protein